MSTQLERFGYIAEKYGSTVADTMLKAVLNSADQAEACRAVMDALSNAFNHYGDPVNDRICAGFAVRIVNVLERGFEAIRADGGAQ